MIKEVRKRIEHALSPLNIGSSIDDLRYSVWALVERGVFSEDMKSKINKMSRSESDLDVLKICFELVEHDLLYPISTLYNSAYVNAVQDKVDRSEEYKSQFNSLDKRLRELEVQKKMSFGHKVEGVRLFLSRANILNPCLGLGEEIHVSSTTEFLGRNESEMFIVRLAQMIAPLKKASSYDISSPFLGKYLIDNNPVNNLLNQKCSLDGFFGVISQLRNADAHSAEPKFSWWKSEPVFYGVIRSYLEPAILQFLLHPAIQRILLPERVKFLKVDERQSNKVYLQHLDRVANPRSFTRVQDVPQVERYRHFAIRDTSQSNKPLYKLLYPVATYPTATKSMSDLEDIFQTFLLWFYVVDGKLTQEESQILTTVAQRLGIVDHEAKTSRLLVTLNAYTQGKKTIEEIGTVLREQLVVSDKQTFDETLAECVVIKNNLIDSCKDQKGDAEEKQIYIDAFQDFEEFTYESFLEKVSNVAEVQRTYLFDFLQNDFHSLSVDELSNKSGLPREIIETRLSELMTLGPVDRLDSKIIELDGKYKTQNLQLVSTFESILNQAREQLINNSDSSLPEYVSMLFTLCADLFQQETNNDQFIKKVARLFSTKVLSEMKIVIADNTIVTQDPLVLFEKVVLILGDNMPEMWRGKKQSTLFKRLTSKLEADEWELDFVQIGQHQYGVDRPFDEKEAYDFVFLLGRVLARQYSTFPELFIQEKQLFAPFSNNWKLFQERLVTLHEASAEQLGRRRSGKSHVRLTYTHDEQRYVLVHRIPNLLTLVARVLYSLEISRHHFEDERYGDAELQPFTWLNSECEPLLLDVSIWSMHNVEQREEWPLKTGRVRFFANHTPFHHSGSEFSVPYCFRLGEQFDDAGKRTVPPIEYWIEMQNNSLGHYQNIQTICRWCNVVFEELEWYPQIQIQERFFSFVTNTLGEDFIEMVRYLIEDLKCRPSEELAKTMVDTMDSEYLAWGFEEKVRSRARSFLMTTQRYSPDDTDENIEVIGDYIFDVSMLKPKLEDRGEVIIEYTLQKVFGMTLNEDYFVHYRTLAEVAEEKRAELNQTMEMASELVVTELQHLEGQSVP